MIKSYSLLLLLLFLAIVTKAQVNYTFSATTSPYVTLGASATNPTLVSPDAAYTISDEGYANAVPIGFNFIYNGTTYSSLNINANGYFTFGTPFIADANENYYYDSLSGGPVSLAGARPVIAPLWADLDLQSATNLKYIVTGVAPNRIFAIEWSNALWDYTATSASISFEALLFETTNVIEFRYKQEAGTPTGDKAGIGITASGIGVGNFLSLSDASGSPTASSLVESKIYTRPATGQVYRFTPVNCFPPTNLILTNVTSTSATVSWTAAPGAVGYEYVVQTTNVTPSGAGTPTTATTVNLSGLTAGVNYVFVRSNCGASFSLWTLKAIVPCTTNISPANGATGVVIPPLISWNAVSVATGYTIMFSVDGVNYSNLGSVGSGVTSTTIPGTLPLTTYYWYVRPEAGNDTASMTCVSNAFSFTTLGSTFNDNICDAIPLTLNGPSNCQTSETATVEANEPTFGCSAANNTLWYTYTPAVSGPVTIVMSVNPAATTNLDAWVPLFTATGTCPSITLTEAFPGTCDEADLTVADSVEIVTNSLVAGTTYYIMVDGFAGATGGYCIKVKDATPLPPGPVNDTICNAIPLILNGPSDCQTTEAATVDANEPTFGCSTPNNTTWYTYTPATSGPATIVMSVNSAATTNLDAWVSLFTPTGACPSLTLTETFAGACDEADLTVLDSVEIITGNLVAGNTYYIMVDGFAGAVGGYCIKIKDAAPIPPGPVNDSICNAILLTLNGPADCQTTETATIEASEPAFGCSTPNNTVWYTYTPTIDGPIKITINQNPNATADLDAWIALFTATGTCPNLTLAEAFPGTCDEADLTTVAPPIDIITNSLTAGTTYYIMVDGFAGAVGGFCIQIADAPAPPPCTNLLTPVDLATNVSAPIATLTWSSVTGADGYTVAFATTTPPTALGSTPDTTVNITGLAFNTTYYWSVTPTNAGVPAVGCTQIFSFTTIGAPPPPPNDPCTGAINLPAGVPVPATTISATESLPANACNGFTGDANDDVWFSITALYNGDASITVIPDGNFDAVMEAFTGSCTGTLTSIACADDSLNAQSETLVLTGLTVGQVVYIRVFNYDPIGAEGTFTITANGSALPVKLVSFKGERAGSKNNLYWSTASEQNNRGFELQRSADGENFSSLTFVPSKATNGNSSTALSYQYFDEKPLSGNNYYRLKQVDIDGKVTYSFVVLIKGVRSNSFSMSAVYPNPTKATLKVVLSAPGNNTVRLVITDLAGKVIMQQASDVVLGDNLITVNVGHLPSGSYMIKAVCTNGCETTVSKFVKQ